MATPNYAALPASDGSGEPVRATVQSPRSIGSTAITVNATTNWPTGTFIATTGTLLSTGKLDPTTAQVFYGTASGTAITITGWAAGYTDKGNAIGDVVVLKPTTEWANVVASGLQSTTQFPANFVNFVEPTGGVWSVTSGLVGAATAGNVWYNGTRSAMAAVTSKTFTASKDTYVDYNPSAATWTYVVVTTGAAEPAVTTGCVRVAKAAAGASTVVFSQGAYNNVLSNKLPATATVATSETTTSTSYVDLTTTTDTVTVTIGANGLALVSISANMNTTATFSSSAASFAISGATTVAAGATNGEISAQQDGTYGGIAYQFGSTFLITGLTPGSTTFKMKYKVSGGTGTFASRKMAVVPL